MPNSDRRRRLEDLLVQRAVARAARQVVVDPTAAVDAAALVEFVSQRVREASDAHEHGAPALSEKQLGEIGDEAARRFPVVQTNIVLPSQPRQVTSTSTQSKGFGSSLTSASARSALLFPPLQGYSPRTRSHVLPHPPGTNAVPRAVTMGSQKSDTLHGSPRAAIDPTPPSSQLGPRPPFALVDDGPRPPSTARPTPLELYNALPPDTAPGSIDGSRSARTPRRAPPDAWSKMALHDQHKYVEEQAARHVESKQTTRAHREFLQRQVELKKLEAEQTRIKAAQQQEELERHLRAMDEKAKAEAAKKKARDDAVKAEIDRQLHDTELRKERERLRTIIDGQAMKAQYDQALEEERKNTTDRRWAAFLVQQESLKYNERQEHEKALQKERELEQDKAALKILEEQTALNEARRTAHFEKIRQKASRAAAMAASMEASAEEQRRTAEERAERQAAAARAAAERAEAEQTAKKLAEMEAIRTQLVGQMAERRRAHDEELARDAQIAAAMRNSDAEARARQLQREAERKQVALRHRLEVEQQIRDKAQKSSEPLGLTRTEVSLNRRMVLELEGATPALSATA